VSREPIFGFEAAEAEGTMQRPTCLRFVILAGAIVFVAPAHAFTSYETKNNSDDSYLRYSDPDKKVEEFGNGNVRTPQDNGPVKFNFNVGPSNGGPYQGNRFNPAWGPQAFPDSR
jgi:hypothetical protein